MNRLAAALLAVAPLTAFALPANAGEIVIIDDHRVRIEAGGASVSVPNLSSRAGSRTVVRTGDVRVETGSSGSDVTVQVKPPTSAPNRADEPEVGMDDDWQEDMNSEYWPFTKEEWEELQAMETNTEKRTVTIDGKDVEIKTNRGNNVNIARGAGSVACTTINNETTCVRGD